MGFRSWVSNSKHIAATVARETELAQGFIFYMQTDVLKYSVSALLDLSQQETHQVFLTDKAFVRVQ